MTPAQPGQPPSPLHDAARWLAVHDQIAALDPDGPPFLSILRPPQEIGSRARGFPPPLPELGEGDQGGEGRPRLVGLLPGSFDPLTRAHAALARAALGAPPTTALGRATAPPAQSRIQNRRSKIRYPDALDLLLLTLTRRTVDKEDAHVASLEDRALLLQHWAQSQRPAALSARLGVALCNRGLYVEQAQAARRLFPTPTHLVFIVGYDKLVQILDPRYYDHRDAALNQLFALASLWVAPRGEGDSQAMTALLAHRENRNYARRIHLLDLPLAFARLSATGARAALHAGRLPRRLLPAATLRFIRDTGTYRPSRNSELSRLGGTMARALPPLPALGEGVRG